MIFPNNIDILVVYNLNRLEYNNNVSISESIKNSPYYILVSYVFLTSTKTNLICSIEQYMK